MQQCWIHFGTKEVTNLAAGKMLSFICNFVFDHFHVQLLYQQYYQRQNICIFIEIKCAEKEYLAFVAFSQKTSKLFKDLITFVYIIWRCF